MLVNFSGSMASCFQAKFGKYWSTVRLFTVNLPEPARKNTRAMDSLRRPVPRNQFAPAMGVPVELNDTSSITDNPRLAGPKKLHASGCSLLDEGRHRNVRNG